VAPRREEEGGRAARSGSRAERGLPLRALRARARARVPPWLL